MLVGLWRHHVPVDLILFADPGAEQPHTYLPPALVAAMRGTVQDSENRIARLLFKLAVEVNMMMNVLAAGMEISDEDLKTLRARSVREVKQTNGRISFKDAIDYQRGVE